MTVQMGLATLALLLFADERLPDETKKPQKLLLLGCRRGHLSIVEFFAEKVETNPVKTFLKAFFSACAQGHLHVVRSDCLLCLFLKISFLMEKQYIRPCDYNCSYIGFNAAANKGRAEGNTIDSFLTRKYSLIFLLVRRSNSIPKRPWKHFA